MELAGDPLALPALLNEIEPTLKLASLGVCAADGFCSVTLTTELEADLGEKLLQALPARGYRVRAFSNTQPSLEDVFLAATRRSWDARLPDNPNDNQNGRAPLPKF